MAIVPFDFNGFELRTLGTIEDPLFVAADVCAVLDIGNVSAACDGLEDDEKLLSSMVASGQTRELLCLTEKLGLKPRRSSADFSWSLIL